VGRRLRSWIELLLSLREAFLEVLRAEVRSLRSDLDLSKRQFLRVISFVALAISVGFWAVGVAVFLLIQVAALWLPLWGATLVVLTLLVLVILALVTAAKSSFREIEEPASMVRRHFQDHMVWWEEEVLPTISQGEERPSLESEHHSASS
jgi:hypothetical protein